MTEAIYDRNKLCFKVGDIPFPTQIEVVDRNQSPVDLSTATARFIVKSLTGELINKAAVISSNTVSYTWVEGETHTAGRYYGSFEITFAAGIRITVPQKGYIEIDIESL